MYIVIIGSVLHGLTFIGPFATDQEAIACAEDCVLSGLTEAWDITRLQVPSEFMAELRGNRSN